MPIFMWKRRTKWGIKGSIEKKVQAIEYLDERVIRLVKEGLDAFRGGLSDVDSSGSSNANPCENPYRKSGSVPVV